MIRIIILFWRTPVIIILSSHPTITDTFVKTRINTILSSSVNQPIELRVEKYQLITPLNMVSG